MRYLILGTDGEVSQTTETFELNDDTASYIAMGELTLIRFSTGIGFEVASVHAQDDSRSLEWAPIEEHLA